MPYRRVISIVLLVSGLLWLTGCAGHEGLRAGMYRSVTTPSSPVVEKIKVAVPTLPPDTQPDSLDYHIGIGDLVAVTVYGQPELSVAIRGSRVDGSGNIQLPLLGSVKVAGLTTAAIRDKIEISLRRFVQIPSVVVEVMEYRSMPLYLLGHFHAPGVYYMDRPMTLMQGIALGKGFDGVSNIRGTRLLRDKKIVPIDMYELIQQGRLEQNFWLKPGDTIVIPDNFTLSIFVFGAVLKPGMFPMGNGRLSLTEAIALAAPKNIGPDLKNVRIIRSLSTTTGELLVVDVEKILRGEALPFQLMEGDVIYVPKNMFAGWNDVINEILPSLQAISAFVQPFVLIKYLQK